MIDYHHPNPKSSTVRIGQTLNLDRNLEPYTAQKKGRKWGKIEKKKEKLASHAVQRTSKKEKKIKKKMHCGFSLEKKSQVA